MRRIIVADESWCEGGLGHGLSRAWIEIDPTGHPVREIGFDDEGHVVHRWPDRPMKRLAYGIFDLNAIEAAPDQTDVAPDDFDAFWNGAEVSLAYLPEEVERGEHQAWHIPIWGCLVFLGVLAAGACALLA